MSAFLINAAGVGKSSIIKYLLEKQAVEVGDFQCYLTLQDAGESC